MRKPGRAEALAQRGAPRGDSRVAIFRQAFESLLEALDATVRLDEWRAADPAPVALGDPDKVPQPPPDTVRTTASQLAVRLGTANRLAAGRFSGSIADTAHVNVIADAVRRLDAAYVVYLQTPDRGIAAGNLSAAIVKIKAVV